MSRPADGMQRDGSNITQISMLSVCHLCDAARVERMREAVQKVAVGVGIVRINL